MSQIKTVRYVSAHGADRDTVDTSGETVFAEGFAYQVEKKFKKGVTKFVWRKKYLRVISHANPSNHGIYAYINEKTATCSENETIDLDVRTYRKFPLVESIDPSEAPPKKVRENTIRITFFGKDPIILALNTEIYDVDSWINSIRTIINSQIPQEFASQMQPVGPITRKGGQAGYLPPAANTGYLPPPASNTGYLPPPATATNTGYLPPASNTGYLPPPATATNTGYLPPPASTNNWQQTQSNHHAHQQVQHHVRQPAQQQVQHHVRQPAPPAPAPAPVPTNQWRAVPHGDKTYFYNIKTRETAWVLPEGATLV